MPFSARTAATIRDTLLARWRARYAAMVPPRDLDITEGSEAYNLCDALAHELCGIELGAQQAANRVLVRSSASTDLDRFAEDDGTARKAPTTARHAVTVSGPVSSTTLINGATLATAAGLRFTPIDGVTGVALTSIDTDGSGNATITVEAQTAGTSGNVAAGTVLTWSSAPTGFAATGTTSAVSRVAQNAESDATLRQRLLERMREKPASFNRADVREIGYQFAGVGECFVYPRSRRVPTVAPQFAYPGVLTIIPVTPAPAEDSYTQTGLTLGQGLDPSYSRVPLLALTTGLRNYFLGTVDVNGLAVAAGQQRELAPASLLTDNLFVPLPTGVTVDVTVRVTIDPSVAQWPWGESNPASREITASSTTWVDLDSVTGISSNSRIAVFVGTSRIRGGWWLATVQGVAGLRVTFAEALPSAPELGAGYARPDCGLWDGIRRAVLMLFDALGPGDAREGGTISGGLITGGTINVPSARYPRPTTASSPDTLFQSRLSQGAQGVDGVLGVTVPTPSGDRTPAPGYLLVPGAIVIEPTP